MLLSAPARSQDQPEGAADQRPPAGQPNIDHGEGLTAYERESLAVDRASNRIAQAANTISEAQREYAFWQLVLGVFGVGFTAIAAAAAIAAAFFAKRAADAAAASAKADNEALEETRTATAEARKDAAEQSKRMTEQLRLADQTMEYTARSAHAMSDTSRETRKLAKAMQESADAAKQGVTLATDNTAKQLRPYVYIIGETIAVSAIHINLDRIVGDHAPIHFTLKNFGQTPAKRVRLQARAFIGEEWTDGGLVDLDGTEVVHRADMPPGFERGIKGYVVSGLAEPYASILLGERSVFFDGRIEYEDAVGNKYITNFRRASTGRDILEGLFSVTEEGNDAT